MDWNNLTSLAEGQGMVFWAAAAAISLGLTMLVMALVQALRQQARRRAARRAPAATPVAPAATVPAPEVVQAYAAGARLQPTASAEEGSIALLLRRLQQAGDRLEEIAGDLDTASVFDASGLKSGPPEVEYVFRASGS